MELLSVCPMRLAGAIWSKASGLELRVVVRATLDASGETTLDLSAAQSSPDDDDLRLLEDDADDRTEPPPDPTGQRLAGRLVGDGTAFAFDDGSRSPLTWKRPSLRPRLFLDVRGEGREVPLEIASVTLERLRQRVTITWKARTPVSAEGVESRAVLGLERDGDPLTWTSLLLRTRGLSPASIRQRLVAALLAPGTSLLLSDDETVTLGGQLGAERGDATLPFLGGRSSRNQAVTPPPPVAMPVPVDGPPEGDRRSIGQRMIERPTFGRPPARHEPPAKVAAPIPADSPQPSVGKGEQIALDLVWFAEGASTRMRRQPALKRLLGARATNEEIREARDVATVAREAEAIALDGLDGALTDALDQGILKPAIVVVDGVLGLSFDPEEELRALISAARPHAATRERIASAIESAEAKTSGPFADSAWFLAGAELEKLRGVIATTRDDATRRLLEAVGRKLTKERKVAQVSVLGAPHAVAWLAPAGSGEAAVPKATVYLPLDAVTAWPLVARFEARLIVEARPPFGDDEHGSVALVAIAVHRRVALVK